MDKYSIIQKAKGCLIGLAIGDAMGDDLWALSVI